MACAPPRFHAYQLSHGAIAYVIASFILLLTRADETCTASLPAFISYTFVPDPAVTLNFTSTGENTTLIGRSITACQDNPVFADADVIGDIAIVISDRGQGCKNSKRYSYGDYEVVPGVSASSNFSFTSYKVSPPASKPTWYLMSGQNIWVRVSPGEARVLYELVDGLAVKRATLASPEGSDVPMFVDSGVEVYRIKSDIIFMVAAVDDLPPVITRRVARAKVATDCMDSVPGGATVGDLAIVTTTSIYSSSCWTDGRYNGDEVLVEQGVLSGDDGSSRRAYRVHPPVVKPTEFLSSKMGIKFRASASSNFVVRAYAGDAFHQLSSFAAEAGNFSDADISADDLSEPTILVFSESAERLSIWPLEADIEVATLASSNDYVLSARRFSVAGRPFIPETDWQYGPGTHVGNYGNPKKFVPVDRLDGWEGIVWEDKEDASVMLTWLSPDLSTQQTFKLAEGGDRVFLAACSNAVDQVIVLIARVSSAGDYVTPTDLWARRYSSTTGAELASSKLPTQKSEGLNMYAAFASGASMAWNPDTGLVGVVLSRVMTMSGDGLNHQAATAFVLDASSLNLVARRGQTASHSFGNSMILDSSGSFLGMDLGDAAPRGILVWRFDNESRKSRTVYRMKTLHAQGPTTPTGKQLPEYTEISDENTTFYTWSNDNWVYTELAHPGIVEVNDGLLIFFAGEVPAALDNSLTGKVMNIPRQAAFVKVPKDLSSDEFLSDGPIERGGFYGFGGKWSNQTTRGVTQLTNFSSMEQSVSRLKTVRISGNETLLWWELWSAQEYFETQFMIVDNNGTIITPVTKIDYPARLAIQDDIRVLGSKIVAYAGTAEGRLARFELCLVAPTTQTSTSTITTTVTDPPESPGGDGDGEANKNSNETSPESKPAEDDVSASGRLAGFALLTAVASALAFFEGSTCHG